jgi:hypothetical protein
MANDACVACHNAGVSGIGPLVWLMRRTVVTPLSPSLAAR